MTLGGPLDGPLGCSTSRSALLFQAAPEAIACAELSWGLLLAFTRGLGALAYRVLVMGAGKEGVQNLQPPLQTYTYRHTGPVSSRRS